ncbi:toll/interleukin-1 receptor domain-containing protein [bacterium]|nr:toll/interleukin-1 receptor domain-containing protein [bacterium]
MSVFVSHATADDIVVDYLCDFLTKAGAQVWLDHDYLGVGDDWRVAIQAAMNVCTCGLVVISRHALNSNECRSEWEYLVKQGKPIYVVKLENVPDDRFPYRFDITQWVDLTHDYRRGVERLAQQVALNCGQRPVAYHESYEQRAPGEQSVPGEQRAPVNGATANAGEVTNRGKHLKVTLRGNLNNLDLDRFTDLINKLSDTDVDEVEIIDDGG